MADKIELIPVVSNLGLKIDLQALVMVMEASEMVGSSLKA